MKYIIPLFAILVVVLIIILAVKNKESWWHGGWRGRGWGRRWGFGGPSWGVPVVNYDPNWQSSDEYLECIKNSSDSDKAEKCCYKIYGVKCADMKI